MNEVLVKPVKNRILRGLLVAFGTFSVVLGVIGIILPVLPTTPFLLLAAACYAKSSETFYNWLLYNRYLGPYIRNYLRGLGIPLKAKIYALIMLWLAIGSCVVFFIPLWPVKILLVIIALAVSVHLIRQPTHTAVPEKEHGGAAGGTPVSVSVQGRKSNV